MKVYIYNFRCFKEKVVDFPDSKLCLLKGGSGTGKSTTLEAIRWCLFGNLRNIYPNGTTGSAANQAQVLVDFGYLKVVRTQPPELLRIYAKTKPDDENFTIYLENESAQKYVDNIFGSKDIWFSSSYIAQGERCPLMTYSNNDKMNLLCDILFGSKMETMNSDNPEWYVQKIDEELQKTSKELTGQTALYNSLYAKYNEAAKTYKPSGYWTDMSKITDDVLQSMSQEISTYKQNINTLTQKMLHVKGVETERKMLHERFENLEKTVASFSNIDASLIQNYRNQIINLENEINNLSKLYLSVQMKEQTKQMLSLKISEIQTQLSSLPKISEHTSVEEINTYRENLNNYESKLSLLKNLQYKYDLCNNSLNLTLQKISELVYVKINDDHELLKSKIKNTRSYNKLNEVKSREPEVLTDFKFESENLEKVVLDLQNYIYNYDNIVKILESYSLGSDPYVAKSNVESTLVSIKQVLDFINVQKIELEKESKRNHAFENFKSVEHSFNDLQVQKDSIIDLIQRLGLKISNESSINDIITLKTEINMSIGDNLNCPQCNSDLEIKGGKLCKLNRSKINHDEAHKQISLLDKLCNTIQLINVKQIEYNKAKIDYESLPVPNDEYVNASSKNLYPEATVNQYVKYYNDLQKIDYVKISPIHGCNSKSEAERAIKAINSIKIRKSWELEFEKASANYDLTVGILPHTEDHVINAYENELLRAHSLKSEKENNEKLLYDINSEIFKINNNNESVEELGLKISEIKNVIQCKEKLLSTIAHNELLQKELLKYTAEINNIIIEESSEVIKSKLENNQSLVVNLKETLGNFSNYEHTMNEYNNVKSRLECLVVEESSDSLNQKISEKNEKINTNESYLSEGRFLQSLMKIRNELEETVNKVNSLNKNQSHGNRLRILITEVTNTALQSLVDNINGCVNSILEDLFDSTITLELKLFKETKANSKLKPQVNFSIYYNGNTYDNVTALSGGEKDRISLALTLALACVNPSPILFLDECMASLNGDLREACIEAIKKFVIATYRKTVINICHETVEGYYDEVINVV